MKNLSALMALCLLLSSLAGCTGDTPPAESTDLPADATTPAETESDVHDGPVTEYSLAFGDPVVVTQGEWGDQTWGHYQFPELHRTKDGNIVASWQYGNDNHNYDAEIQRKISTDGGKTWTETDGYDTASVKNPMKNGKYFAGFVGAGAHTADYPDKYTPLAEWSDGTGRLYLLDDIKDDPAAAADIAVKAREYDAATGEYTTFDVTVNWQNAPFVITSGRVYPLCQLFALTNRAVITIGEDLYIPIYSWGFDSFAESEEDLVFEKVNVLSVYVFKSTDSGRTWNLLSQVCTDENVKDSATGLCEPEMGVMPDGSVVMLMRTGDNNPSYLVRSTDLCQTWSAPVRFDTIGVLPQLLTLDCGVTLSTYGRPTMRLKSTADPAGLDWKRALEIRLTGGNKTSCYYTDLLPLDEYTALWIYTDFNYENEDGDGVKTVLVRTVTVVPE